MTKPLGAAPVRQTSGSSQVIDFDRYIPTVLSRLVWKFRASADHFFGGNYGINLIEWRIISFLAAQGATSAYAIWTEANLDKAAVSRALRKLAQQKLVSIEAASEAGRRRKTAVALTAAGRALHQATFSDVVARHARLVEGLPDADLAIFFSVLRHLERRIPMMKGSPSGAAAGDL